MNNKINKPNKRKTTARKPNNVEPSKDNTENYPVIEASTPPPPIESEEYQEWVDQVCKLIDLKIKELTEEEEKMKAVGREVVKKARDELKNYSLSGRYSDSKKIEIVVKDSHSESYAVKIEKIADPAKFESKVALIKKIKNVIADDNYTYLFDLEKINEAVLKISIENKSIDVQIIYDGDVIKIKSILPFPVECGALALVSLYINELNAEDGIAKANIYLEKGEICFESSYPSNGVDDFEEKFFFDVLEEVIFISLHVYVELNRISTGKVVGIQKDYYKKLLEMSLATLNGAEIENIRVTYGSKEIKDRLFEKNMKESSKRRFHERFRKDLVPTPPINEHIEDDDDEDDTPAFVKALFNDLPAPKNDDAILEEDVPLFNGTEFVVPDDEDENK